MHRLTRDDYKGASLRFEDDTNKRYFEMVEPLSNVECTVGLVYIPQGMLFFKNRDLSYEYLLKRVTVFQATPEAHILKGFNLKTSEVAGVSIGVNKHKVCVANTHVVSTRDVTYDMLCERLINEVKRKRDVLNVVEGFMKDNTVQGGRILVASPEWAYLVEVFKDEFRTEEVKTDFAITNTFSLLAHKADRSQIREESSLCRLKVASQMIKKITNIGQLKSMLRSHIPEKGNLSICNHSQDGWGTESSHIIQIQGDYISWSSLVGYPCENDYNTLQLFQR